MNYSMNMMMKSENDVSEKKLLIRLIGIIAHDIKSPIEQSLLYLSLIDDERLSDEDYLVFKNTMQIQLTTSQAIINGLLDWIKGHISGEHGLTKKIFLHNVVDIVISSMMYLSPESNFHILNNVPPTLEIVINTRIYEVVLRNFLTNAIKFSGKDADIAITVNESEGMLLTTVADNGVGMSAQKVNKIVKGCEADFSVSTGSGIGLILCRDCLEHYGGELIINSIEGEGTKASFTIPYTIV